MATYLLVEDDHTASEVINDILTHNGDAVSITHSAYEALATLETSEFDAVIIDLRLPDLNGWELMRSIQKRRTTPCVAITAFDNPQVGQAANRAGFSGYFPKPLNEKTFAQRLAALLGGAPPKGAPA